MSQAPEPFGSPQRTIATRNQPSPPDTGGATPCRVALETQGLARPVEESAGRSKPMGSGTSGTGTQWEHTRDMLAIMMTILAAQDGIASAKKTALACWEEANSMARTLCESSQVATQGR